MSLTIHPRLVNQSPFDDPGLFINFSFSKRALLFDLGDLHALSPRDILKVTHVFVTHTHMDHFIGFDHVLRIWLGREKTVHIFGPVGLFANIEGKLAGYTWNLLHNFQNNFSLKATEVHERELLTKQYIMENKFAPLGPPVSMPFEQILLAEPDFCVKAEILDHGIPCLGLALTERFHVNIIKVRLHEMGLDIGPWLKDFKQALYAASDWSGQFTVPLPQGGQRDYCLKDLVEKIAIISPGQKIAYITDVAGHAKNQEKILSLSNGADHLFIEAAFADEDFTLADSKHHLTAGMAGTLAKKAGAKQMTVFHFSPRYQDTPDLLSAQALAAFTS